MMKDIRNTLISTTIFNLITLMFVLSCGFVIHSRYIIIITFGLLMGVMNLYLRAITLNLLSQNNPVWKPKLYFTGYTLRIGFTALAGALLFLLDKYYVLAYMGGYILHFSGIILHGVKLMVLEGK